MNIYKPSIGELKQNNERAGKYFFSKGTMRFFGRQKMSIVLNEDKTAYILKIRFLDNGRIGYYKIKNNGADITSLEVIEFNKKMGIA